MLGMSKEQIIEAFNYWMDENETAIIDGKKDATEGIRDEHEKIRTAFNYHISVTYPNMIASIIEQNNRLITKQVQSIIDKVANIDLEK